MAERWINVTIDAKTGKVVSQTPLGVLPIEQKFSREAQAGKKTTGKDIDRYARAVKLVMRFVFDTSDPGEDEIPDETFGVDQFTYQVDIDKEAPDDIGGREQDPNATIIWGCANFQRLGVSARDAAELVLNDFESVRSSVKPGSEEYDDLVERTAEVIKKYYPGNSRNKRR
jgi:hypothetical protein